jgi:hypothetical protein
MSYDEDEFSQRARRLPGLGGCDECLDPQVVRKATERILWPAVNREDSGGDSRARVGYTGTIDFRRCFQVTMSL